MPKFWSILFGATMGGALLLFIVSPFVPGWWLPRDVSTYGSGIDALMYHWIWTKGGALGYHWGEGGWILEDNTAMVNGAHQLGFRPYKTYRIYDKPL